MDCGCKYHCGQSGKEERWVEAWSKPSEYNTPSMQWARPLHSLQSGKSALASPPAQPALFCLLFAIYWSTRNWITLTSVLMQGRRKDSHFSSLLLHRSNDILALGCWPGLIKTWISTARFVSKLLLLKTIIWKGLIGILKLCIKDIWLCAWNNAECFLFRGVCSILFEFCDLQGIKLVLAFSL